MTRCRYSVTVRSGFEWAVLLEDAFSDFLAARTSAPLVPIGPLTSCNYHSDNTPYTVSVASFVRQVVLFVLMARTERQFSEPNLHGRS